MPFNPRDFLSFAQNLVVGTGGEAHLRTAVSRAYYAVHLQARENLGLDDERRPSHDLVIITLRSRGGVAGEIVDGLRKLRITADYRLRTRITATQAQRALDLANAVWPQI